MSERMARPGRIPWPPLIYILAIAIAVTLEFLYPLPWIDDFMAGDNLVGDILFAIGWLAFLAVAALWFTSIRAMMGARTPMHPNAAPEHLVTKGPFGITRNPMYLANTMLLIGVGLVSGSLWFLLLAIAAAFATTKLAIEGEERRLAEKFGKKYRDYARRVRRWV